VGEYELYPWQTNGANYYNGGGFRYSHDYGFGFVDAAAAVRLSESWKQQRTSANEMMLQGGTSPFLLEANIPADINQKLSFDWNISSDSDITIEWVELQADMTHSWWGDLDMTLTSPSGTKHTLLNRIGVSPDFVRPLNPDTNSVDLYGLEGKGVINHAFASTVSRGESSIGQWKLEINGRSKTQGGMGAPGVLKSVQLSLFGSESPGSSYENTPTYYYTDRYAELLKLEPERLNRLEGDFGKNAVLNFAASSEAVIVDLSDTQAQLADLFIPIANSSEIHTVFGGGAADKLTAARQGSSLYGGWGDDQLFGSMGSDFLSGGKGNDLIRAGIGRDIISGDAGSDELHGDFGWNTFKSEIDDSIDLLVIKSDEWLVNPLSGTAGNNPNGGKADILEGLDSYDQIKIVGVYESEISIISNSTAHGLSGIGIYAKGALEALYTGDNLSVAQITAMTSGDGSAAAMANQISSYGLAG
jgi:subtilisin-like proprotein convertase family protein